MYLKTHSLVSKGFSSLSVFRKIARVDWAVHIRLCSMLLHKVSDLFAGTKLLVEHYNSLYDIPSQIKWFVQSPVPQIW